jgi:mannosylglycerate hydrolase
MESHHHLVVVPHTHWDREWYRTHEEFRYRLVSLVDRLLDILEGDPAYRHFMLDGQTIVVDDYLEVRPQARERLGKLVRDGRILVGPWHVLPDEWLVSGEALIRNLRLGLTKADALGGAMRLGYVPDQFGHVGQLPQIFAGFGFDAAVLWRGVGADVQTTPFHWDAPDGTRVLTVYLPQGYGNAAQLPLDREPLAQRLRISIGALSQFATTQTLLMMNGSDHLQPQPGLPAALDDVTARVEGLSAEIGTLPRFLERVREEAPEDLSIHRGELRSGLRSPLLPGCASARMPQKRADFRNDTLLTKVLEPLAAWLSELGGDPDTGILDLAWRVALENHPHDSICGCSIDAVHDQMDTRFARVLEIAHSHLRQVGGRLARCVSVPVRGFGRGAGESLLVWNPNAGGRAVVDARVELEGPVGADGRPKAFHLRDANGGRLPVCVEDVEPEMELFRMRLPKGAAPLILDSMSETFAGNPIRWIRQEVGDGTLHIHVRVSEFFTGYDVPAARGRLDHALVRDDVEHFDIRVTFAPRGRLRFADDLPGHGLRVYRLAPGRAASLAESGLASGREGKGAFAENEHWRIECDAEGRVLLKHRDGTRIEDAVRVVSEGDRGDEYNFDPVPDATPVEWPERVRVKPTRPGESEVGIEIDSRYRIPAGLTPDRGGRSDRSVVLPVRIRLRLHADTDRVDVDFSCDNTAEDHRLRLHVRAPFAARRFEVESAFEIAERPLVPRRDPPDVKPSEEPIGSVPQRAFASVDDGSRGLCVAHRGAAEVEAIAERGGTSSLAVTMLRAVGWLSRPDLTLRPGHAGPGLATPGAQVPGRHVHELSLFLHDAGAPDSRKRKRQIRACRSPSPRGPDQTAGSSAAASASRTIMVNSGSPFCSNPREGTPMYPSRAARAVSISSEGMPLAGGRPQRVAPSITRRPCFRWNSSRASSTRTSSTRCRKTSCQ